MPNQSTVLAPWSGALGWTAVALAALYVNAAQGPVFADDHVAWLVRVAPRDLGPRTQDEMPAEIHLDAREFPDGRRLDLSSLRVVAWDTEADRPTSLPIAHRWYDDSIPFDFPECEQNVHATDGLNLQFTPRPGWGEYYDLLGDGQSGKLVWLHAQVEDRPADYQISCRLLPPGEMPTHMPSRGMVGNGSHRCAPQSTFTGMVHSRVAVADWNADGLLDLLIGNSRGHVLVHANVGSREEPRFTGARPLMTADGRPLDVGWSSAPVAVDWDGDGRTDLLSGAERNRVLFYRQDEQSPSGVLTPRGFVLADGVPLELPIEPVPKSQPGVYTLDYYPVLEAVDWNGNGRLDLLAGGYVTGRIFLFENIGANSDGTPRLTARGPLSEASHVLNVGDWAAAPCAADFDADGDLDLISGNMPLNAGGGDASDPRYFLRYYENTGTRTDPELRHRPFPKHGEFPDAVLATPRAADMNADGLLDLVVSANANLYLFYNRGTRSAPDFEVSPTVLTNEWGNAPLPTFGLQFVDWDHDGQEDMLAGLTVYRKRANGEFDALPLLSLQPTIDHPAAQGDGWIYTQLADLDGDGQLDLLYGTHAGHVWLHRRLARDKSIYDQAGEQLLTTDRQPIQVGPLPDQKVDFDVVQGARTTFAVADFDGDQRLDLVVGDTYGKVRYYQQQGSPDEIRFALPVEIGDVKIRLVPCAADWNADGRTDVVASAASGTVVLYPNLGEGRFGPAEEIPLPAVPYGPSVNVADWNGDGDPDLIVGTAYGYFCWFDRSFLLHGVVRAERLPANR